MERQEALVESVLQWWRDAGVNAAISEDPAAYLRDRPAASRPVASDTDAAAPEPLIAMALPESLEAFVDWLMNSPLLAIGGASRRLAPIGSRGAELMIVTDMPDSIDLDHGRWFAGELGALFDRMLKAIGRSRDAVYITGLCPARPASGRIGSADLDALIPIVRHHVRLVAPKFLWAMGNTASRALLGMDDAAARGQLHVLNLNDLTVQAIATAHPRLFATSPARKAAAWTEMQRLIA